MRLISRLLVVDLVAGVERMRMSCHGCGGNQLGFVSRVFGSLHLHGLIKELMISRFIRVAKKADDRFFFPQIQGRRVEILRSSRS